MTYLGDMGILSLGSQLKAVSDQLYACLLYTSRCV